MGTDLFCRGSYNFRGFRFFLGQILYVGSDICMMSNIWDGNFRTYKRFVV